MKRTLILFALFTVTLSQAGAQQLSEGILSGSSYWMDRKPKENLLTNSGVAGKNFTWSNSVFLRYELKKFAFEAEFNRDRQNTTIVYYRQAMYASHPPLSYYPSGWAHEDFRTTYVSINLKAQFNITPGCMQRCPALKKLKIYAGLSVAPVFINKYNSSYFESDESYWLNPDAVYTAPSESLQQQFTVWLGLNGRMSYTLSKHFDIIASGNYQVAPEFFDNFGWHYLYTQPDSRLSAQIGAAYKF